MLVVGRHTEPPFPPSSPDLPAAFSPAICVEQIWRERQIQTFKMIVLVPHQHPPTLARRHVRARAPCHRHQHHCSHHVRLLASSRWTDAPHRNAVTSAICLLQHTSHMHPHPRSVRTHLPPMRVPPLNHTVVLGSTHKAANSHHLKYQHHPPHSTKWHPTWSCPHMVRWQ